MARPTRKRIVCSEPEFDAFTPHGIPCCGRILLTVDEFECIRWIDLEGLSQMNCATRMEISRTTVAEIYASARHKLADMLVNGKPLSISGGNYVIYNDTKIMNNVALNSKGDNQMRIAVTYENENIFQHFGHTENFKIYDVEDGSIIKSEVIGTAGNGHGALADFMKTLEVDTLICGGIGMGAQEALSDAGITLYGGASGNADAAVNALISGTLEFDPNVKCNHHGDAHEHGHNCGHEHKCGHNA